MQIWIKYNKFAQPSFSKFGTFICFSPILKVFQCRFRYNLPVNFVFKCSMNRVIPFIIYSKRYYIWIAALCFIEFIVHVHIFTWHIKKFVCWASRPNQCRVELRTNKRTFYCKMALILCTAEFINPHHDRFVLVRFTLTHTNYLIAQ